MSTRRSGGMHRHMNDGHVSHRVIQAAADPLLENLAQVHARYIAGLPEVNHSILPAYRPPPLAYSQVSHLCPILEPYKPQYLVPLVRSEADALEPGDTDTPMSARRKEYERNG